MRLKLFILLSLLLVGGLLIYQHKDADAESTLPYLRADFHLVNDPTCCWGAYGTAPQGVDILMHAASEVKDTTIFKIDCTGDGTWDFEQGVQPFWIGQKQLWDYYTAGRSEYHAWFYDEGLWAAETRTNCYYPNPGDYTVKFRAERAGLFAEGTRSFYLRPPSDTISLKPTPDNGTVPLNGVDMEVIIRNDNLNSRGGSLLSDNWNVKFDCTNDGKFDSERTLNFSSPERFFVSSAYGRPLGGYYKDVCSYSEPGLFTAKVVATANFQGGSWNISDQKSIVVRPSGQAKVEFSTGGDSTAGPAPLNGVDLKLEVKGVFWADAYYNFSCGNGQTRGVQILINRDFNQDYSYTLKDFCNYTAPGEYVAKADIEFRAYDIRGVKNTLPFTEVSRYSDVTVYKLTKELKIVATGKLAEGSYIVTSPFDLRWNASRVASCSVSGVSNSFSSSGSSSGSVSMGNVPPNDYKYKLACTSVSGTTAEKIINVKVVKP